jgi:predicted MFS family arabinose efflux permease
MTTFRPTHELLRPLLLSTLAQLPLAALGIGLLVHVQHLTGSFGVAGLASGTYAAAAGIGAPGLGRLADRHGRRVVLLMAACVSSLALTAIALAPPGIPPLALVALSAVAGLATPPVAACMRSVLPRLVDTTDVRAAFAFEASALELTFIAGPPLVLGIGAAWSTRAALGSCAVLFLVATALFGLTTRLDAPEDAMCERGVVGSLASPAIRTLVLALSAVGVLFGAVEIAVTATAIHIAGVGAAAPLLALWGVGSLAGGIAATRFGGGARSPRGLGLLIASLAITHAVLATATASLAATGALLVAAGATIAPTYATVYAIVGCAAPAGTTTEAFTWLGTAIATGSAIGVALAGALVDQAGPRPVLLLAGVAGCAALAVTLARAHTLQFVPTEQAT